jgi:hypothetical protein
MLAPLLAASCEMGEMGEASTVAASTTRAVTCQHLACIPMPTS